MQVGQGQLAKGLVPPTLLPLQQLVQHLLCGWDGVGGGGADA